MAYQNGSGKFLFGNADVFGGHLFNVITYMGAPSYNNGVGDYMDSRVFGFPNLITALLPLGITVSGTYYCVPYPNSGGRTRWNLRWFVLATNQEVAGGQDLSKEVLQLMGIGI